MLVTLVVSDGSAFSRSSSTTVASQACSAAAWRGVHPYFTTASVSARDRLASAGEAHVVPSVDISAESHELADRARLAREGRMEKRRLATLREGHALEIQCAHAQRSANLALVVDACPEPHQEGQHCAPVALPGRLPQHREAVLRACAARCDGSLSVCVVFRRALARASSRQLGSARAATSRATSVALPARAAAFSWSRRGNSDDAIRLSSPALEAKRWRACSKALGAFANLLSKARHRPTLLTEPAENDRYAYYWKTLQPSAIMPLQAIGSHGWFSERLAKRGIVHHGQVTSPVGGTSLTDQAWRPWRWRPAPSCALLHW